MKIYILPVSPEIRPATGYIAPAHNQDYGVEQDFERWLRVHPELITSDPKAADWHYFPAYFNRYYCNYWGGYEDVIQSEILRLVTRAQPTFTICEYDLQTYYPTFDLCNMVMFCASRKAENGAIDIPLLCSLHQPVAEPKQRKWLASFMGKFETDGSREMMRRAVEGREDVYLSPGVSERSYVELMVDSEITLAPRGHGGQSFRFYEAMQFASVPMLIGDLDTRPFKEWINWDEYSFYARTEAEIIDVLDNTSLEQLWAMGEAARILFIEELYYGKWCKYVLMQLSQIS